MFSPLPNTPEPPPGVQVGTYQNYAAAQRAVDHLSDNEFPVQHVSIVGTDLKLVERVTGRLTQGKAISAGAAAGAWWGLFIGILFGLFGPSGTLIIAVISSVVVGLVFGTVFGWISYRVTGGQRDFTSRTQVVAGQYAVLCAVAESDRARELLAQLALRTGEL